MSTIKLSYIVLFFTCIWGCNAQKNLIVIHDPVVIETDGLYYIFATGPGIESAVSNNLINWTKSEKPLFDSLPEWFKKEVPKFNGHIWAPDIIFRNGIYYLYYSISSFGSNLSFIGVATNKTLDKNAKDYKWENHRMVIQSKPGRDSWNAIDPNIIIDENQVPWMAFGSFWSGIKMVKLNDDLLSVAQPQELISIASRTNNTNLADSANRNDAIEGPFIIKKGNYYYLFVSFDLCCRGSNSTYNVRVGRSECVTGPYYDHEGMSLLEGGGTLLIGGNDDFYAIGHNSVYNFGENYYMFSHGYDVHDKGKPKLLVHQLEWDQAGWPQIKEYIQK
ncbi:MAG TPA: arabinan endo-1,5-alpha-L-arabinosidase [Marinilabiliales bacterium]|nr:arabinan endo-1,5-alpha-L-arabinosidase [Marinilabiliales bacterium]HAZ01050.1 arabinan endo-1,5-alpha-L-arabinosidase [Marinilabiliales bacterium]HBO75270.1 arabinan endo-1,5-alpha-L-arabinosidase [Marinilabiliales bacterium]HBX86197.1 arabinan endo-1,5-alpha-L-arabinosidase [Marinilabiliales bacterium]HBY51905.1 arabinan endo-1,5-alpha-L-arabinosidase [Marinilabiliales bacterium]